MTSAIRWVTATVVVAGGALVAGLLGTPIRSGLGYLAGLLAAVAAVAVTTWMVALAAARWPILSLVVALGCYLLTVLAFAAVLAAVDPTAVETRAVAAGLGAGVLVATVAALQRGSGAQSGQSGRSGELG